MISNIRVNVDASIEVDIGGVTMRLDSSGGLAIVERSGAVLLSADEASGIVKVLPKLYYKELPKLKRFMSTMKTKAEEIQ